METKLTLLFGQSVIERAKEYAKAHKISLSRLVENYLIKITADEGSEEKITPLVRSLSGVLYLPDAEKDHEDYGEYLSEKYQ
ncbi:hypothetical protein GC167_06825 [bacterium]|nr:hypothetical protein [bacterium]